MPKLRVRDLMTPAWLEGDVPLSVSDDVSTSTTVREVMTWNVETIEADDEVATATMFQKIRVR